MTIPRVSHGVAGVVAGLAGIAAGHATAQLVTPLRPGPLAQLIDLAVRVAPQPRAAWSVDDSGGLFRPVVVGLVVAVMLLVFLVAGRLTERRWWAGVPVYAAWAGAMAGAVAARGDDRVVDHLPPTVAWVAAVVFLSVIAHPMRAVPDDAEAPLHTRRAVLGGAVGVGVSAAAALVVGRVVGASRKVAERSRTLLNLPVTRPRLPDYVQLPGEGISPWQTPTDAFFRVDTAALTIPALEATDWQLRIHGLVERELVLTYRDLVERELTEAWVTLVGASNPVGGPQVGNAWWSGVRTRELLAEAGVLPDADAVLQTAADGWSCLTPLGTLTDERDAMVALAMNGAPLSLEHGFPARTLVPGLYGYVSACKWVVDLEVTRFDRAEVERTAQGWAERAPVKLASRIDVPRDGAEVAPGRVRVGGVAWQPHRGVRGVEYAVDGGPWRRAETGGPPRVGDEESVDTWVHWAATIEVEEGEHVLRVRALGRDGQVQSGVRATPQPDGATGWHEVRFTATT